MGKIILNAWDDEDSMNGKNSDASEGKWRCSTNAKIGFAQRWVISTDQEIRLKPILMAVL